MSEQTICTIEQLKNHLKQTVSEKRFIHSEGVAQTTEKLLEYFNCKNYVKLWNGFSAGTFCGFAHDLSREYTDEQWLDYCKERNYRLEQYMIDSPVMVHGFVSAETAKHLVGDYPESWYRAIENHTIGNKDMDDLALALFIADYIEPSRTYITDKQREAYLANPSIYACAYNVLCDMMSYWKNVKHYKDHNVTLAMKEDLEKKL